MVNSRTEATLDVVGLEKALAKMENFLLEFRAAKSAVVSSSFPLAAMASTNPLDELSFAALPPAPPPPPLPQPHLQDIMLRVVPPSVVEPTSLLHSSPPPQPQPQFARTPKLLSAPMLLPRLQQELFLAQSNADIQIQPPCLPLLRGLVSAASHQSTQMMVSFPGSPYASIAKSMSFQWFDALAAYRKHEFEPPPTKCCVSSLSSCCVSSLSSALRARLF